MFMFAVARIRTQQVHLKRSITETLGKQLACLVGVGSHQLPLLFSLFQGQTALHDFEPRLPYLAVANTYNKRFCLSINGPHESPYLIC